MTKDSDFVEMLQRLGPPPKVLWVICGNTSNARLREILSSQLPAAVARLEGGENLVEIGDDPYCFAGKESYSCQLRFAIFGCMRTKGSAATLEAYDAWPFKMS